MKLKVIGWTYYEDNSYETQEVTWATRNAVKEEIIKHKYLFTGYHHQEYDHCVPVLNNGKKVIFSQRGFGGVMAEAYNYNKVYDYSLFAYPLNPNDKNYILPKKDVDESLICDEKDLIEIYQIELDFEEYAKADVEEVLVLKDSKEYEFLEVGDIVELRSGEHQSNYNVVSIERKKDVSYSLEYRFRYRQLEEYESERKQIEEEYINAPTIVIVTLEYRFFK